MKLICPDHPEVGMIACEQATYFTPVVIELAEDGSAEIESVSSEHVRDMATTVTLFFKCADDECAYTVRPEELEREYSRRLPITIKHPEVSEEEDEAWREREAVMHDRVKGTVLEPPEQPKEDEPPFRFLRAFGG